MVIRKSRNELEKMRRAGLIVAETLRDLRKMVEPGITTRQLDSAAEKKIRAIGAYPTFKGYRKFPSSICASVNDSKPLLSISIPMLIELRSVAFPHLLTPA